LRAKIPKPQPAMVSTQQQQQQNSPINIQDTVILQKAK